MGVTTGHSASMADFNWSHARIFVSSFDSLRDFIVIVLFYNLVNFWALRLFFAHNIFVWAKDGCCAFVLTI